MRIPHVTIMVLLLLAVAETCLALWLFAEDGFKDFGLNAFTETLGILFTVLIVDSLIKRRDELHMLPQKATAYEDVRLLASRMVQFWAETYRSCVPEASPATASDLLTDDSFDKMAASLNLDAHPNVKPKCTWWEWLPHNLLEHKSMASTILERHNSILEPSIYAHVHKIAVDTLDPNLIITIRNHDIAERFPRPHVLCSYYTFLDGYIDSIKQLVIWCEKQHNFLEKNGVKGLKRVASTIGPWEKNENPPSKMDENALKASIDAVEKYRAMHRAERQNQQN